MTDSIAKKVGDAINAEIYRQRVNIDEVWPIRGIIPPLDWGLIGMAALTAMREPTPEMHNAAMLAYSNNEKDYPDFFTKIFQAMIDAALNELVPVLGSGSTLTPVDLKLEHD